MPSSTTLLGHVGHATSVERSPLRRVHLHVLRELAHHCGHADVLRELVHAADGRPGRGTSAPAGP